MEDGQKALEREGGCAEEVAGSFAAAVGGGGDGGGARAAAAAVGGFAEELEVFALRDVGG